MLQGLSKAATLLNNLQVSKRWVLNAASYTLHISLTLQPICTKVEHGRVNAAWQLATLPALRPACELSPDSLLPSPPQPSFAVLLCCSCPAVL